MMFLTEQTIIVAELLRQNKHTVSVAESSTGGLISANLLAVPGASSFYQGGSVVYTKRSRFAFLDLDSEKLRALQPLSEEMVIEFARGAKAKLGTTWGVAELGVAGPTGTPYGSGPGVSVIGIAGPVEATIKIETGSTDREENMLSFTSAALRLLHESLLKVAQPES
jgi:nicotinamide-nucleotide amidase